MRKRTQEDHVKEEMGFRPEMITERLFPPGIETLHEKPTEEIGEALALCIKSRNNVKEVRYKLGECIEIISATHS